MKETSHLKKCKDVNSVKVLPVKMYEFVTVIVSAIESGVIFTLCKKILAG